MLELTRIYRFVTIIRDVNDLIISISNMKPLVKILLK